MYRLTTHSVLEESEELIGPKGYVLHSVVALSTHRVACVWMQDPKGYDFEVDWGETIFAKAELTPTGVD